MKSTVRDDFEKNPRPNIDSYEVQVSLSSRWLDRIDEWFIDTIKNGKNALAQLGSTGIKVVDHIVEFIPTKEAVFRAAKEVLFALPQEVLVYVIDAYCTIFLSFSFPRLLPIVARSIIQVMLHPMFMQSNRLPRKKINYS